MQELNYKLQSPLSFPIQPSPKGCLPNAISHLVSFRIPGHLQERSSNETRSRSGDLESSSDTACSTGDLLEPRASGLGGVSTTSANGLVRGGSDAPGWVGRSGGADGRDGVHGG